MGRVKLTKLWLGIGRSGKIKDSSSWSHLHGTEAEIQQILFKKLKILEKKKFRIWTFNTHTNKSSTLILSF